MGAAELRCWDLPSVSEGYVLSPEREYYFGDSTKVICRPGFRAIGSDTITCLQNQTFR